MTMAESVPVPASYQQFAGRLVESGLLSDPWVDGAERFVAEPIVLSPDEHAELTEAAESVAMVYDELARLCASDAALVQRYFRWTPFQRLLWETSAPAWHGIARADVFWTPDGPKICELNSDTPSGEAEAVILGRLAAAQIGSGAWDPTAALAERFCQLLVASLGREPRVVGLIYPTELTEDLSMILLYRRWCEARGWHVVLGSPFNLQPTAEVGDQPAGVQLFGQRLDVVVRHYKTDWWTERQPVWRDEAPFSDAQPLTDPLRALLSAELAGQCVVVNPWGAVLTQNKRTMALMWQELERFSPAAQDAIVRYVPYTVRLEDLSSDERVERIGWVLKSDYGCEGSEVLVGAEHSDFEWQAALTEALPGRWIAQRRFCARADRAGRTFNFGVYLVAGRAAGYLTRVQKGATDGGALTIGTLVANPDGVNDHESR